MRTCQVEMWDGKVACAYSRAGRVDVETCLECPRLREFYDEESGAQVVCAQPLRIRLLARTRASISRCVPAR
jgi:hypothetical protein